MTITISIIILRVVMGFRFLIPGLKMLKISDKSAKKYLEKTQGSLSFIFKKIANSRLIDNLNKWLLILIGLSLILGVFIKISSIFGIIMMIIYWLSKLGKYNEGIINENIIYIAVFILFLALN